MPILRALVALTVLALTASGCGVQVMVARQEPPTPPQADRPDQPTDTPPEKDGDVSRE